MLLIQLQHIINVLTLFHPFTYLLIEEMMKDSKYLTQMNPVDIVENLVDEILTLNN